MNNGGSSNGSWYHFPICLASHLSVTNNLYKNNFRLAFKGILAYTSSTLREIRRRDCTFVFTYVWLEHLIQLFCYNCCHLRRSYYIFRHKHSIELVKQGWRTPVFSPCMFHLTRRGWKVSWFGTLGPLIPARVGHTSALRPDARIHTRFRKRSASLCPRQFSCQRCILYPLNRPKYKYQWFELTG